MVLFSITFRFREKVEGNEVLLCILKQMHQAKNFHMGNF